MLLALYWLGIYTGSKNPMEELFTLKMVGWMHYVMFKPFTETIGNDGIWKEDERISNLPLFNRIVGGQRRPIRDDVSKDSPNWLPGMNAI